MVLPMVKSADSTLPVGGLHHIGRESRAFVLIPISPVILSSSELAGRLFFDAQVRSREALAGMKVLCTFPIGILAYYW